MKISVITVVYNSVDTIGDALRSVSEQSYGNIEHIVIDGASTDGTVKIIDAYSDSLAHVVSEPDEGIYDAMNKGVCLASGDVIGFLNSDDVFAHSDVIQKIASLHEQVSLDAVYANLIYLDNLSDTQIKRYWRSRDYHDGLCFKGWMPAHPTLYLKRRIFDEVGGFKKELGNQADLEFCARVFELLKISSSYCPEIWVHMRTGGASQSSIKSMIKSNWNSYLALRGLGLRRDPITFFAMKFGMKLPQFFARK